MTDTDFPHEDERFIEKIEFLAEIGGWELYDEGNTLQWTAGALEIFDVPHDYESTLDAALEFFHKADRQTVENAIAAC